MKIGFLLIVSVILKGTVRNKFRNIYNPIKKDNGDYSFVEVEAAKTRSILEVI